MYISKYFNCKYCNKSFYHRIFKNHIEKTHNELYNDYIKNNITDFSETDYKICVECKDIHRGRSDKCGRCFTKSHDIKSNEININDTLKEKIATENGYKILRFWESDIKNNPEIILKDILIK
jgi:very-short-patch-repair endonuclease